MIWYYTPRSMLLSPPISLLSRLSPSMPLTPQIKILMNATDYGGRDSIYENGLSIMGYVSHQKKKKKKPHSIFFFFLQKIFMLGCYQTH
jgi:hypothetical protein